MHSEYGYHCYHSWMVVSYCAIMFALCAVLKTDEQFTFSFDYILLDFLLKVRHSINI